MRLLGYVIAFALGVYAHKYKDLLKSLAKKHWNGFFQKKESDQ